MQRVGAPQQSTESFLGTFTDTHTPSQTWKVRNSGVYTQGSVLFQSFSKWFWYHPGLETPPLGGGCLCISPMDLTEMLTIVEACSVMWSNWGSKVGTQRCLSKDRPWKRHRLSYLMASRQCRHPFSAYLMWTFYMPGAFLGAGHIATNKTDDIPDTAIISKACCRSMRQGSLFCSYLYPKAKAVPVYKAFVKEMKKVFAMETCVCDGGKQNKAGGKKSGVRRLGGARPAGMCRSWTWKLGEGPSLHSDPQRQIHPWYVDPGTI